MNNRKGIMNEKNSHKVKCKKLEEVVNILDQKRKPIRKDKRVKGIYPYYGANGIQDYVEDYILDGTYILIGEDGSVVNKDGSPILNWTSGKIWVNNHAHILEQKKENILLRYIFYYLQTIKITSMVKGTPPKFNQQSLRNLEIPIPSLKIQSEMVHVLDDLTLFSKKISENLSEELKARQKQFEYYRDEILAFKHENYEYKTLEEIATDMYRGNGIKRTELTEIGMPCVRYGEIYTSYNITFDKCISHTDEQKINSKKYFEYGDILFAITGENIEEIGKSVVYLGKEKCLAGGDMVVMKHNQNPKYMAYVLSTTSAQMQKSKGKVKSKVVHTGVPALKKISIPIPPIEIQGKIANILEKLYKIWNDISEELLVEIEERQKQYKYYRDKILSFEKEKDNKK